MSATGDPASQTLPAGFTLIEALVVVAIMALIGGLAFPRIEGMLDGAHFAEARTALGGAAAAARARAIRTDTPVALVIGPDGSEIFVGGTVFSTLPPKIKVASDRAGFTFFADGSASGGKLILSGPSGHATLAIFAETGVAQWLP